MAHDRGMSMAEILRGLIETELVSWRRLQKNSARNALLDSVVQDLRSIFTDLRKNWEASWGTDGSYEQRYGEWERLFSELQARGDLEGLLAFKETAPWASV